MEIGDIIKGYTIKEYIGDGGMGIVFKVEKDGKEYALKICNTTDDEYVSRFKREIRMMETINNNRIVKIIDKDIDASIPYFIMELCDESLENAVERGLSEEKKFDYILQLCDGLKGLHDQGIIHRDIKPGNALIVDDKIKVSDLGLGKFIKRDTPCLTPTDDKYMGTYDYMAPEIYIDGKGRDADKRSDIFSLGKLLYFIFTDGESPFAMDSKKVTADIFSIIDKCTKLSPDDRYQDVGEVINAIKLCLLYRNTEISVEEIISNHRLGINDKDFVDKVYNYLLKIQGELGLLIKSIRMLKMQDLTIFLRYKKSEVNIIKDILLNTFSENNDYYIQWEDVDVLVHFAFMIMNNTSDIQIKKELLAFTFEISKDYHRFSAMSTTLDMLNSLSSGEVKSIIPFIIEKKDYINTFKSNTNKSISDSIKLVIN